MSTVGAPGGIIVPVGLGIGATQAACVVMSPTRAAGMFAMRTVGEPCVIRPGPPGTHPGRRHGVVVSVIRAAGWFEISTVGAPEIIASGKAG
jgi:hypothetical protein